MRNLTKTSLGTLLSLAFAALAFSSAASYAADEVKLLSNINVSMTHYGISWQNSQAKILVKNIAYEKKVSVIFEREGTEPTVSEAKYFGPAKDGYEVWIAYSNLDQDDGYTFRTEYKVQGETFVDDNEGKGFALVNGPALYHGQALQQVNTGLEFQAYGASVTAALRGDLAYEKNVILHYSFDNGIQGKSAFKFVPIYLYGYGAVPSPTPNGTEIWQAEIRDIPSDVSVISYTLTYEAKGVLYVDDNFGQKYRMTRYK